MIRKRQCNIIVKLILFLIIGNFNSVDAQILKESEKIAISHGLDNQFGIIGKYSNRFFCYNAGKDIQVFVYDTAMVLINKIKLEFIPDNFRKIDFLATATGIVVVYQYYEDQSIHIKGVLLDEDASLKEFPKDLWTVNIYNPNSLNNFEFASSEDKKSMAFYVLEKIKSNAKLHLLVIDNKLNVIDTLNYTDNDNLKANEIELSIDNNKTIAGVFGKKNSFEVYSSISTFMYNKQKNLLKFVPVEITEYFFNNKKVAINNKSNQMHILAYMKLKGEAENQYVLHKTFDLVSATESSSKVIQLTKPSGNKKTDNLDFVPQQIIFRNDGGLMALSEYQNINDVLVNPNTVPSNLKTATIDYQRRVVQYNYAEIHILSLNKLDGVENENYIHKNQMTEDDNGYVSSYYTIKRPKNLSLIYNALDKNNTVYYADVSPDGNFAVNQLSQAYTIKTNYIFSKAIQVGGKETIVPCFTKGNLSFVKLLFN